MAALSAHQFNTLAVLARDPDDYAVVWCGAGSAGFGMGEDPFDRMACADLILSVPKRWRWPPGCTVKALERKGYIQQVGPTRYGFIYIYQITEAGLAAYKNDPAFDSELVT